MKTPIIGSPHAQCPRAAGLRRAVRLREATLLHFWRCRGGIGMIGDPRPRGIHVAFSQQKTNMVKKWWKNLDNPIWMTWNWTNFDISWLDLHEFSKFHWGNPHLQLRLGTTPDDGDGWAEPSPIPVSEHVPSAGWWWLEHCLSFVYHCLFSKLIIYHWFNITISLFIIPIDEV